MGSWEIPSWVEVLNPGSALGIPRRGKAVFTLMEVFIFQCRAWRKESAQERGARRWKPWVSRWRCAR